jgi:hypothetical protein
VEVPCQIATTNDGWEYLMNGLYNGSRSNDNMLEICIVFVDFVNYQYILSRAPRITALAGCRPHFLSLSENKSGKPRARHQKYHLAPSRTQNVEMVKRRVAALDKVDADLLVLPIPSNYCN